MSHDAKFWVLLDAEKDAPLADIGISLVQQSLCERDDARNFIGGLGIDIWTAHIECIHIFQKTCGLPPAEFVPCDTQFFSLTQNIIVNVGYILYILDLMAVIFEVANERIE